MSLNLEITDGIATITMARPERKNAIDREMRDQFQPLLQQLQDDDEVRTIILTGANGDFAAGADLGSAGQGGVRGNMASARGRNRLFRAIAGTSKPVIAAVEGVCIGMAFSMALMCDFIICAEDARFRFAFRHVGLAMDGAAGWLLERHVGVMRAKEIAYSGRFVSGVEAAALGFALEAVPQGEALARARSLAKDLADAPTLAISAIKRQFDAGPGQTFDEVLESETATQALMTKTEDFAEGVAAFKEKRKPRFRGA